MLQEPVPEPQQEPVSVHTLQEQVPVLKEHKRRFSPAQLYVSM